MSGPSQKKPGKKPGGKNHGKQSRKPERLQSPKPEQPQSPEPEQLQSPEPEQLRSPEPEQLQSPEPEQLRSPEPEQLPSPEPEQLQSPEPEQLQSPEPEQLQSPEPEQLRSPEPEQMQSLELQDSKTPADAAVAPANTPSIDFQTLATAYGNYTKKSFEQTKAFVEKLSGVRSVDKAVEIQIEFAKQAYETFVAESQKIRELYSGLAKQSFKRFEGFAAKKTRDPR